MLLKRTGLAAAVLLASSQFAFADDLQINGFINVTAGVIDNKDIMSSSAVSGYDTTVGYDQNTLAGLQISKKVNDNTSATLQLMSRGSQGYKTEAAWAYITYELTENTDIRFGRLRTPFFHYSDFLEVGYAYNWITPPGIVYRLDTMSAITGADLTHRFTAGAVDGSFQIYSGRYKDDFSLDNDAYEMELRSAAGAVLSLNYGDFGARASYHQAEFYINGLDADGNRALDGLLELADGYDKVQSIVTGGNHSPIAPKVAPQGETSNFYQASVFWDNGSTSLIGEFTALRHDSFLLNDDDAWLVSAAQRLGDVTVHATYAFTDDKIKSGSIGNMQKIAQDEHSSITLGLRYDYNSSVAFKADASYITYKSADTRLDGVVTALKEAGDPENEAAFMGAVGDMLGALGSPLVKSTGTLYTVGMSIVF